MKSSLFVKGCCAFMSSFLFSAVLVLILIGCKESKNSSNSQTVIHGDSPVVEDVLESSIVCSRSGKYIFVDVVSDTFPMVLRYKNDYQFVDYQCVVKLRYNKNHTVVELLDMDNNVVSYCDVE